jgi:hypothetical protein
MTQALNILLTVNGTQFASALSAAQTQVENFGREIGSMGTASSAANTEIAASTAQIRTLGTQSGAAATGVGSLASAASTTAASFGGIATAITTFSGGLTGAGTALSTIVASMSSLSASVLSAAGGLSGVAGGLGAVGSAAGGASAGTSVAIAEIAALGAAASAASAGFAPLAGGLSSLTASTGVAGAGLGLVASQSGLVAGNMGLLNAGIVTATGTVGRFDGALALATTAATALIAETNLAASALGRFTVATNAAATSAARLDAAFVTTTTTLAGVNTQLLAFGAALTALTAETTTATGALTALSSAGAAAGASAATAKAGFMGMFAALGGLAAGAFIVKTASDFEKLQTQLVTTEGSVASANVAFQQIQKFAATTPYSLEEVTGSFIKLKNLGLEPSEKALTAYGNTASSMGKSLDQFIEAVADASTGEFERLKEFGIKASQQGDEVALTFKGQTDVIGNNAEAIQAYLQNIGNTEFSGAMERQMDTLSGQASNLADAFAQSANSIAGTGGFNSVLTDVFSDTAALLNENQDLFAEFGQVVARIFALLADVIAETYGAIKNVLNVAGQTIGATIALVAPDGASRKDIIGAWWDDMGQATTRTRGATFTERLDAGPAENQIKYTKAPKDKEKDKDGKDGKGKGKGKAKTGGGRRASTATKKDPEADYKKEIAAQERKLALMDAETAAEKMLVDIHAGKYGKLNGYQTSELLRLADLEDQKKQELDLEKRLGEAAAKTAQEQQKSAEATAKKREAEAKKIADDLRPTQAPTYQDQLGGAGANVAALEAQELARESLRYTTQQQALASHRAELIAIGQNYDALEAAAKQQHEAAVTDIAKQAELARQQQRNDSLNNAANLLGQFAQLAQSMGERGFKAYKALSIAEAMINTYRAASNALATLPQPFNFAAAAVSVAAGLQQVAQIRAQNYAGGRERGGMVSGGNMYQVGERGRPELLESNGNFYLIPGDKTGNVQPAKTAGSSGLAGGITVNLSVIGTEGGAAVRTSQSGDQFNIELFVGQVEKRLTENIARGNTPVARQLERTYGVRRTGA